MLRRKAYVYGDVSRRIAERLRTVDDAYAVI
jgi:hypothetical protein